MNKRDDDNESGSFTPWEVRALTVLAFGWGAFLTFAILNAGR